MIIESGIIIFFGMLLLGTKLPRKISLKLLGHPLALDLGVSVLAYIMHYGTFSGVMAAAVAGLMCSGFTSCARYAFGYIENKRYHKGRIWQLQLKEDELK
jgi:hypothetical protein